MYLAIDCALAEHPPSAHDVHVLRDFTPRSRRAPRADCVHMLFGNFDCTIGIGINKKFEVYITCIVNK